MLDPDFYEGLPKTAQFESVISPPADGSGSWSKTVTPKFSGGRHSIEWQAALGVANHIQFLVNRLLAAYLPALAGFKLELAKQQRDLSELLRASSFTDAAAERET